MAEHDRIPTFAELDELAATDPTALREVALDLARRVQELQTEIGDAWEVLGQNRTGGVLGPVLLGPAGGPLVTVQEEERLTLPQWLRFLAEHADIL